MMLLEEVKVLSSADQNALKFTDFNVKLRELSYAMSQTLYWIGARVPPDPSHTGSPTLKAPLCLCQ